MIFLNPEYLKIKTRLASSYEIQFQKVINELPPSQISKWIKKHVRVFKTYSPANWFLITEITKYILLSSFEVKTSKDTMELSYEEDMIFEAWNKSEFADVFLKRLNRGESIKKASAYTLDVFDAHITALAQKIAGVSFTSKKSYRTQHSLGDGNKPYSLNIDETYFTLFSSSLKEAKKFSTEITRALILIKKFSPDSWVRFQNFTQVIIPIKQKELVSYSHQELPGTSMINLYDRDFIDLLDDLLHENGHHHLNYYLNTGKLIDEPIDAIYYSPWRRTLRPLRGIYHAYFTFFWAFKLFSDLAQTLDDKTFTKTQKEKIFWRAVEEFYMLEYVFEDLLLAKKAGLINVRGWKLIEEQRNHLLLKKKFISVWEKKISKHKKELLDLKKTLKLAKKNYHLKPI